MRALMPPAAAPGSGGGARARACVMSSRDDLQLYLKVRTWYYDTVPTVQLAQRTYMYIILRIGWPK